MRDSLRSRRNDMRMTVYDETTATVRALAARARATENVLFCERVIQPRPPSHIGSVHESSSSVTAMTATTESGRKKS